MAQMICGVGCRHELRSHIAVAVAVDGSCSSNSTPNLGNYLCCRYGPKKKKKKDKALEVGGDHTCKFLWKIFILFSLHQEQ